MINCPENFERYTPLSLKRTLIKDGWNPKTKWDNEYLAAKRRYDKTQRPVQVYYGSTYWFTYDCERGMYE